MNLNTKKEKIKGQSKPKNPKYNKKTCILINLSQKISCMNSLLQQIDLRIRINSFWLVLIVQTAHKKGGKIIVSRCFHRAYVWKIISWETTQRRDPKSLLTKNVRQKKLMITKVIMIRDQKPFSMLLKKQEKKQ